MFRRFLNVALVLSLTLSVTVFAQKPSTPVIDRLRQKVIYLASDMLDGRRTGTQGANDAAHFIADEFSLLGLRPGLQTAKAGRTRRETRARYLQSFPYIADVALGKNNQFHLHGHDVRVATVDLAKPWHQIERRLLSLASVA